MDEEEKKQYVVIKIRKPAHFERVFWILLVVVLLTAVLYKPISGLFSGDSITDNVKETNLNKLIETKEATAQVVKETEKETTPKKETTTEEIPEEETVTLTGDATIDISDIEAESMTDDTWGRINKVRIKIVNGLDGDLTPTVTFSLENGDESREDIFRLPFSIAIKPGQEYDQKMSVSGLSVRPLDDWKLTAKLFDADDQELDTDVVTVKEADFK